MTASAVTAPAPQRATLLNRSFMGTGLTIGGAIITLAAAPGVWLIVGLVWAALPS